VIRLLLAEDHPVVRAGLEKLVANEDDIELVGSAANGAEAVDAYAAHHPDITLLDLRMPGLDGFEVCRRVKEAPATKATKIVAMTGFDDEEAQQLAMTCGADVFVTKREGLTALGRQIKGLLDADAAPGLVAAPSRARPRTARSRATRLAKKDPRTRR